MTLPGPMEGVQSRGERLEDLMSTVAGEVFPGAFSDESVAEPAKSRDEDVVIDSRTQ